MTGPAPTYFAYRTPLGHVTIASDGAGAHGPRVRRARAGGPQARHRAHEPRRQPAAGIPRRQAPRVRPAARPRRHGVPAARVGGPARGALRPGTLLQRRGGRHRQPPLVPGRGQRLQQEPAARHRAQPPRGRRERKPLGTRRRREGQGVPAGPGAARPEGRGAGEGADGPHREGRCRTSESRAGNWPEPHGPNRSASEFSRLNRNVEAMARAAARAPSPIIVTCAAQARPARPLRPRPRGEPVP